MSNFAHDILRAAEGEPIETIVIGEMGWEDYNESNKPPFKHLVGQLLFWDKAFPILNYNYNSDFGAPECQAITAWTESWVLFVVQYDGATYVERVPRDPIAHMPHMPGG